MNADYYQTTIGVTKGEVGHKTTAQDDLGGERKIRRRAARWSRQACERCARSKLESSPGRAASDSIVWDVR